MRGWPTKSPAMIAATIRKTRPTVTDAEYDALRRRYAAIEARFPDLRRRRQPDAARRRRAVARASPRCGTRCRCSRSTTPSPKRTWSISSAASAASCACPKARRSCSRPSRRSTACRCRCATRTASSSPARRAATAPRARTSPPTSKTLQGMSADCSRARMFRRSCEVRGEVYMTKRAFLELNERAGGGRQAAVRQSAQRRGGLAAPARPGDHRRAAARASSPMPGAR